MAAAPAPGSGTKTDSQPLRTTAACTSCGIEQRITTLDGTLVADPIVDDEL